MDFQSNCKCSKYTIYDSEEISDAIKRLALHLNDEFSLRNALYICILNGAVPFFTQLTQQLPPGQCEYIRCSSYGNSQTNSKLSFELPDIDDYSQFSSILVIDDICDTGITMMKVTEALRQKAPLQTNVIPVCLINRLRPDKHYINQPFSAFETGSTAFFAGFGMDNKGKDRNLLYIYDCSDDNSCND